MLGSTSQAEAIMSQPVPLTGTNGKRGTYRTLMGKELSHFLLRPQFFSLIALVEGAGGLQGFVSSVGTKGHFWEAGLMEEGKEKRPFL